MINKPPLYLSRIATSFCMVACTGCASFFGPYGFETNYRPAQQQANKKIENTSVSITEQKPPSSDASASSQATQSEFDIPVESEVESELVTTQTVNLPNEPVSVEFPVEDTNEVFEGEHVGSATVDDEENPFSRMAREGVLPVSHVASSMADLNTDSGPETFRPSIARVPTAAVPNAAEVVVGASAITDAYPDEYIFDGGDRDHPVHYFGGKMQGLDTEDTVVEFKDHEGGNHVKASNRVAVYAPRFGAIQTVSGPGIGVKYDKAVGAVDFAGIGTLEEKRQLQANIHRSGFSGMESNNSASGVETAQPAHMSERTESAVVSKKVDQGMESRMLEGPGLLRTSDVHELNLQILEPSNSESTTAINMAGSTSQATQTYSTFRVQATVGSEEGGRKGEIHITKNASPLVAKAGDVVTFTIQFKNTGDYNVSSVRIIDNLTPRLTYVTGSGRVNVSGGEGGSLMAVPNKEGSQTMIFELDNPLPGGRGGTITFQARVL